MSDPTPRPSALTLCPSCDVELPATTATCPRCGAPTLAIRAGVDPNLGRVVDERYELRAVLGSGGMGTVYLAWQRSVEREVAVKLIHPRHRRDVTWIRRFLREARLSSQLHHPHVVGILDFGQSEDGDLFLVMERVEGRTLADLVASDGPLDPARVVRVGLQVCDALAAVHDLGIVHRDLKPHNVMVLDDGAGGDQVKLLDFGLARSLSDSERAVTEDSHRAGTPYYMAPELLAGEPATPATDLYALGVILCEAQLGARLFTGGSFAAVQREKSSLRRLPAGIAPALRDVLGALVEPSPTRRPQRASEVRTRLAAALDDAAGAPAPPAPTTPRRRGTEELPVAAPAGRRRAWIAAALALVIAAGATLALALRDGDATPTDPARALDPLGCRQRSEKQIDLTTGRAWSSVWYCNNDRHTPLYLDAALGPDVAVMDTVNSWFVCYRRGAWLDGSDVWYWTQGDEYTPGWMIRRAWGYMPARNVHARVHPYPGIPPCAR